MNYIKTPLKKLIVCVKTPLKKFGVWIPSGTEKNGIFSVPAVFVAVQTSFSLVMHRFCSDAQIYLFCPIYASINRINEKKSGNSGFIEFPRPLICFKGGD